MKTNEQRSESKPTWSDVVAAGRAPQQKLQKSPSQNLMDGLQKKEPDPKPEAPILAKVEPEREPEQESEPNKRNPVFVLKVARPGTGSPQAMKAKPEWMTWLIEPKATFKLKVADLGSGTLKRTLIEKPKWITSPVQVKYPMLARAASKAEAVEVKAESGLEPQPELDPEREQRKVVAEAAKCEAKTQKKEKWRGIVVEKKKANTAMKKQADQHLESKY
jgi:hypothetical protein